jgi:hypothetical protein
MPRRTKPSGNAGVPPADNYLIAIRAHGNNDELIKAFISLKSQPTIERMALHWGYILRVRTRWAGDADIRDNFGTKATKDLEELGVERRTIRQLASVEQIEVEFNYSAATSKNAVRTLDAASEIPWEYLLSSATQNAGRVNSLLVSRCLKNKSIIAQARPRNVLVVESAPGRIGQIYNFEDEEKRLTAAVNLKEVKNLKKDDGLAFAKTDSCSILKCKIRAKAWDAIHVTGVDTHQAAWLIENFYTADVKKEAVIDESDCLRDGMVLRGDDESELPISYEDLAKLLLQSKKPARVISLNLYYSGARTARELVKRGAYAALGFLDEIDDEFAELFFQAFYWAWCHDKKSISEAFLDAWSQMDGDRMYGTNIVIWLGRSTIENSGAPKKTRVPTKTLRRGGR